jgi:hypothetical protein
MAQPNYSGTWIFTPDESTLQITRPTSATFTIDHRGSVFRIARTLAFDELSDTFAIDLMIGTETPPFIRGDAVLHPTIQWDGDDLVFFTRIVQPSGESTNSVRYHLEEHGTRLVADERFRGPQLDYDNRWVFLKER